MEPVTLTLICATVTLASVFSKKLVENAADDTYNSFKNKLTERGVDLEEFEKNPLDRKNQRNLEDELERIDANSDQDIVDTAINAEQQLRELGNKVASEDEVSGEVNTEVADGFWDKFDGERDKKAFVRVLQEYRDEIELLKKENPETEALVFTDEAVAEWKKITLGANRKAVFRGKSKSVSEDVSFQ